MITYSHRIDGFWLSEWMPKQRILTMLGLFRMVKRLMREGAIKTEIAGAYSLDQIRDAAKHVQSSARGGKVLLRIGTR
jgi:NADPH:quinone reductase-like Zn-dependent oxidoreductase